jgi:UDP-GlcNAc:undecaprenyl-phosphate GlcNAc-1-phosphate transferase
MLAISIISLLLSLVLSLILIPLICHFSLKVHAFKEVENGQKQKQPIPQLGGLGVFLSFAAAASFVVLAYASPSPESTGILIGSIIIILLGLADDFVELSPTAKFFGQILSVGTLVLFGISTKIAAIGPLGNILVTILWMLAIINAFNLLDIMDGLCCGIAIIAAGAFLAVSFLSQNIIASILCSSLIGAGLGFLRYNLPPAKIYLGDTGSMFCGFILAAIAITIDYAPLKREIALATPILILGLPIFDTLFVILMRFLHGRPVIRKSRDHFALRLLASGRSKQKALLLMYLFGLFFAASALLISKVSNQQGIIVLILIISVCGIALRKIAAIKIDE